MPCTNCRMYLLAAAAMTLAVLKPADLNGSEVFSFGSNASGRTGLGTTLGSTTVATPIDISHLGDRAVKQVSAGREHSLLLTDEGDVYSFGTSAVGIIGRTTPIGSSQSVAAAIDTTNLGGDKITQVSAGGSHSLILAEDGDVYAFGYDLLGRTGRGIDSDTSTNTATPINMSNFFGRKVVQIDAGSVHSLLLMNDGAVFSFGSNFDGATGLGTTAGSTSIATPIDASNLGGRKIVQVEAGNFSLLLAEDGSVYSFGSNQFGQTGLGIDTNTDTLVATPIDTSNLGGRKISRISAGAQHSLLLADDGNVFAFGANFDGKTGQNVTSGNTTVATPIATSTFGGRKIVDVAAGTDHSLLLADDGSVFSFGLNRFGRTGLGIDNFGDTLVPTSILVTNLGVQRITQISAGLWHSLIIAVPEPFGSLHAVIGLVGLIAVGRTRQRACNVRSPALLKTRSPLGERLPRSRLGPRVPRPGTD